MAEIRLPLSITYETKGLTPVADVIEALKATEVFTRDAISLIPSVIDGLHIEKSSLNVRILSQESPLKEIFLVSLFLAFQDDLEQEVPPMIEDILNVTISDRYDTIVTVLFLVVVFYGAGLAIDAIKKMAAQSLPKSRYQELVGILAGETGKSRDEIEKIIQAKFQKPAAARQLVTQAKRLFLPSQRENNVPVIIDRDRIDSATIREIPYAGEAEKKTDFDRYTPYSSVKMELHAKDRDKSSTGWAAVAPEISASRLKVRVMDPVQAAELWGNDELVADVVVVSKLTAQGYTPAEIQITKIVNLDEDHSPPPPPNTG